MKQFPNNLKFKKYHKVNFFFTKTVEKKIFYPLEGEYALQSLNAGKIKFKQIEACRRAIKRGLKKVGNLWIKIFTNIPVTKKASASRMGKGKGSTAYWIAAVKKGQILFEINVFNYDKAFFIFKKVNNKLPIKIKLVKIIY